MIRKSEKGFTLVLSLVLLLVMSLMGGSLVVISSGDHNSNNTADQYQQAFYVAETGLLQGEKSLINQFMGNITVTVTVTGEGEDQVKNVEYNRDTSSKGKPPQNDTRVDSGSKCYKSFKNLPKGGLYGLDDDGKIDYDKGVTDHVTNVSFLDLVRPVLAQAELDDTNADEEDYEREEKFLKKFTFEYFMVNIGTAPVFSTGGAVNLGSIDIQQQGTAFKIYSCGMMDGDNIIIPLESVMVLPG